MENIFSMEKIFKWCKLSAEQGDVEAQFDLAGMYFLGNGVDEDYEEAVKWYKLSADQGNAEAQVNLGGMYVKGYGVEKDYEEAVKWYRLSADQGNGKAQCNLGIMYRKGYGVEKDYEEAVRCYKLSADQVNAKAQCNLGAMYFNGYGVKKDYEESLKWFKLSADQGNAKAQCNLGAMYFNGYGVKRDSKEALKWVKLSADQGYTKAQNNLEKIYKKENEIKKDYHSYIPAEEKFRHMKELKLENLKFNGLNFWKEKEIFYLDCYQQTTLYDVNGNEHKNPKFTNKTGGYIKQIKYDKEKGRRYYENKLIDVFKSNEEFIDNDYWITIIPGHKKKSLSPSMIKLTKRIEKEFNDITYFECLERTTTIEKLAYGGNRNINVHLSSIEVKGNKEKFKGQRIILLDDITTSGNSMIACRKLLEDMGAEVICISLSKTVERKTFEDALIQSEIDDLDSSNDSYISDDYEDTNGMIYCVEDDGYHDAEDAWMYDGSRD